MKDRNLITLMLILIFIYPLIKGYISKFSSEHLKITIESFESSVCFLVSIFLSIYLVKKIFFQHNEGIYKVIYNKIPSRFLELIEIKPILIYIIVLPLILLIVYEVLKFILNIINKITIYPILDGIEEGLRGSSTFTKRILGAVFEVPRAITLVIIATFILNFAYIFNVSNNLSTTLEDSKLYKKISVKVVDPVTNSKIAKKLPFILEDSLKIVAKDNNSSDLSSNESKGVIIYYNGVTLSEGVSSNEEIDNFAVNLVKDASTEREKAYIIYKWISEEISYDNDKANRILSNIFTDSSGAIPTFNDRKGICFDFSCLYTAMARANGIKVRIITGEGYNSRAWISHAWNQVYISEEDKWINVDTTFSLGGNYFDSIDFNLDHKASSIAGEW